MEPVTAESPIPGLSERRAFRLVHAEAFFGEVFVSLSSTAFVTGLALWLGAGPVALGLLIALPFIAQSGQLVAPFLERRLQSRRRFVVPAFIVGRLLWLMPGALAIAGLHSRSAVLLAMAAIFTMALVGMIGVNGWTAWVADLVPPPQRPRLFAARMSAMTTATMIAVPAGSLWLDWCRARGNEGLGHAVLASVAVGAGTLGGLMLLRLPDAAPVPREDTDPMSVTRRLFHRRGFRRVLWLFSTWNLSVGLPAAFWTVYMLRQLDMGFFLVGLHASIIFAVRLVLSSRWSRLIDRVGSLRVLIGSGFCVALIPLMWMLPTRDNLWPIWVEAVYSGVFWTGFNQAAFIQPISVLAPAERSRGLSLFNVFTGAAMFVASMLGGVILQAIGTETSTGFFVLFGMATVIRLAVSVLALRLTEPGTTVPGFLFGIFGYGILREWGPTRPWLPTDDQAAPGPGRRRSRRR